MGTTNAHVTTAIRALMDHVDHHDLPLPRELHSPGACALYDNTDDLLVIVNERDLCVWLDSVLVDDEDNTEQSHPSGWGYVKSVFTVRLPDHGVRLLVYTLRRGGPLDAPVRPAHLSAVTA